MLLIFPLARAVTHSALAIKIAFSQERQYYGTKCFNVSSSYSIYIYVLISSLVLLSCSCVHAFLHCIFIHISYRHTRAKEPSKYYQNLGSWKFAFSWNVTHCFAQSEVRNVPVSQTSLSSSGVGWTLAASDDKETRQFRFFCYFSNNARWRRRENPIHALPKHRWRPLSRYSRIFQK